MPPDDWDLGPDEEASLLALPGFEHGGRVERTGIALVHEGEFILPAPGSEAEIVPTGPGTGEAVVVNYYFPVEIELLGQLGEQQLRRIAEYVFDGLAAALGSRG